MISPEILQVRTIQTATKTTYTGTYAAQNGTIEAIFISGAYRETENNHDYTFDNTPKRTIGVR